MTKNGQGEYGIRVKEGNLQQRIIKVYATDDHEGGSSQASVMDRDPLSLTR